MNLFRFVTALIFIFTLGLATVYTCAPGRDKFMYVREIDRSGNTTKISPVDSNKIAQYGGRGLTTKVVGDLVEEEGNNPKSKHILQSDYREVLDYCVGVGTKEELIHVFRELAVRKSLQACAIFYALGEIHYQQKCQKRHYVTELQLLGRCIKEVSGNNRVSEQKCVERLNSCANHKPRPVLDYK